MQKLKLFSGHPSCLNYSLKLALDITKRQHLHWECKDCRKCSLCGTKTLNSNSSLLFCDTCDRGFHAECLNPPLEKIPKGPWCCNSCVRKASSKNNLVLSTAKICKPPHKDASSSRRRKHHERLKYENFSYFLS